MKKLSCLSLIGAATLGACLSFAGPEPIAADDSSKAVTQTETDIPRIAPWIGAEASGGEGMGTDDGMLALEGFLPLYQNRHNLFFGFARGILSHNFDDDDPFRADNTALEALAAEVAAVNSTCPECEPISVAEALAGRQRDVSRDRDDVLFASNVGGGYRYYSEGMDRIFGINGFWDWRDTGLASFNQIGVGIETLGKWFDFRANGYIVVGNDTHTLGKLFDTRFARNFIEIDKVRFTEEALTGADAEIGMPIIPNIGLKGYVGGYYYDQDDNGHGHDNDGFFGIRGRLEERLTDDLDIGVVVSHDEHFGTSAMGSVSFRFGGEKTRRGASRNIVVARRADRPQRAQQITVTQNKDVVRRALATNPATGAPIEVVHVDSAPRRAATAMSAIRS